MSDLTPSEFDFLRTMLVDRSAILLEPGKEYLLETRLAPIMRREEHDSFASLVADLRGPNSKRLEDLVVDAMTTNETSFFRDTHPWEALRATVLPALIEARRRQRSLTIWCAASSSGQEPYSLAMLLHEHFPDVASTWSVRIIGTDISPTMVEKSSAGRFSQLEVNRGLPAKLMMKYFERSGTDWQISPDVARLVEFRQGNLADERAFADIPLLDGVFMRNVLIYFATDMRAQILDRAHRQLRPDGFLLLGSAERPAAQGACYEPLQAGRTTFFRPADDTRPVGVGI